MRQVRLVPRAEETWAKDSILVISHKSVIGCSECSQEEDNGAFSRFWSYVRWRFPNKEEAGRPAQRMECGRRCGLMVVGRDVGAGASWVQLPAETLTQGEAEPSLLA